MNFYAASVALLWNTAMRVDPARSLPKYSELPTNCRVPPVPLTPYPDRDLYRPRR
jgi:hypothetical protein